MTERTLDLPGLSRIRRFGAEAVWALCYRRRRSTRIRFAKPCYHFSDVLDSQSVIVDCGLGDNADLSRFMIERYGLLAYGFDPTPKHQDRLSRVAAELNGRLKLRQVAIGGAGRSKARFFESADNVSGSLLSRHVNVLQDTIREVRVDVVPLADAIHADGGRAADLVKLDIEGMEYEALEEATDAALRAPKQWLVEFHHDTVGGFGWTRTMRLVWRFRRLGFVPFTRDAVNFAFVRRQ